MLLKYMQNTQTHIQKHLNMYIGIQNQYLNVIISIHNTQILKSDPYFFLPISRHYLLHLRSFLFNLLAIGNN